GSPSGSGRSTYAIALGASTGSSSRSHGSTGSRYGGSTNAMSKRTSAPCCRFRNRRASSRITRAFAPSRATCSASTRASAGSRSTSHASAAPRDSASRPSAPLPAKRSTTRAPANTGASQLKSVSRTRSGVGRRSGRLGNSSRRPRHLPPMIRSRPGPVRGILRPVLIAGDSPIARAGPYNSAAIPRFTFSISRSQVADPDARKGNGFFAKLKERLNRGRSWLTGGLFGRGIDEASLEEFEERLLTADVGVEVTTWLIERLRKAKGGTQEAAQEALRNALLELLKPVEVPLNIDRACRPFVILVVGVNGTGKTTTIGKLSARFRREGYSVLLAAGDTFRAAAVEQLAEWGTRTNTPVVSQAPGADPAAVVHDALAAARARDVDILIADTAGRLHTASGPMD